jgi:hypothetical protein
MLLFIPIMLGAATEILFEYLSSNFKQLVRRNTLQKDKSLHHVLVDNPNHQTLKIHKRKRRFVLVYSKKYDSYLGLVTFGRLSSISRGEKMCLYPHKFYWQRGNCELK